MKKLFSLAFALIFALLPCSIFVCAADLSDGIYEVPVTLMHKEDDKESFGNKYVAQTALLRVENGQKTVTILLTTNMDGIAFSYYTDGSLSGDVADGTAVSNTTVGGEVYEKGFEIPVMADGDIGLKFSVPVMPMSPSARLRIDYANAVLISSFDSQSDSAAVLQSGGSSSSDSAAASQNTIQSSSSSSGLSLVFVIIALAAIIIFVLIVILSGAAATTIAFAFGCNEQEEKNNDDK